MDEKYDNGDIDIQFNNVPIIINGENRRRPEGQLVRLPSRGIDRFETAIYLNVEARIFMANHARKNRKGTECGGFLLGYTGLDQKGSFLYINIAVEAVGSIERAASLKFTHETWKALDEQRETRFPELQLVGWYHTHPGFGVFYSSQDVFIQRHFFAGDRYVGFVLDGGFEKMGIFQWTSTLVQCHQYYLVGDMANHRCIDYRV